MFLTKAYRGVAYAMCVGRKDSDHDIIPNMLAERVIDWGVKTFGKPGTDGKLITEFDPFQKFPELLEKSGKEEPSRALLLTARGYYFKKESYPEIARDLIPDHLETRRQTFEGIPHLGIFEIADELANNGVKSDIGDLYDLDTICLRYFNVFGPKQYGDSPYSTVVAAWLEAVYFPKKKIAFIEGDGNQSRDFCYVDNVVEANILAMQSKKKFGGEFFNIAHGERTNLLEVKKLLEKYSGKKIDLEKRKPRLGDVRHTHADISKAKKWFGYKPTVNFEEGLKRTVEWWENKSIKSIKSIKFIKSKAL